ncbi:MAG TPA: hypothetical protein VI386_33710 [Candidatus Sulfotelmatobacter sp.]
MEAEEKWFYVWLSIFTVVLGTAPFAYWQGYHLSGIFLAIAGLGGLLMFIRDRLAATASKLPIRISVKVLAVVTLSILVGQLIGHEIASRRANVQLSSTQWWLYGLTLLLVVVVVSATLSKSKPSKLVIHWANYRAWQSGGETQDVTNFLRKIICRDSLVFNVENHNFVIGRQNFVRTDPLSGKAKRLRVSYSYDGEPAITIDRNEHDRLVLPEDSVIERLEGEVERLKNAQAAIPGKVTPDALQQSEVLRVLPVYFQDLEVEFLASHRGTDLDMSGATHFVKLSLLSHDDTGLREMTFDVICGDRKYSGKPLTSLSDWIIRTPFDNPAYPYKSFEEKSLETLSLWRDVRENGLKSGIVKIGWIGIYIPDASFKDVVTRATLKTEKLQPRRTYRFYFRHLEEPHDPDEKIFHASFRKA